MSVKPTVTFLLGFLLIGSALTQNLVPNPSFEKYQYCPVSYNQSSLTLLESWRQATLGTPDFFHSCSSKAGVPENIFGDQEAKSGSGYAGLVTFASSKRDYREYLYAPLSRKLSSGEMVCVELYVSPADDSRYVTDGLGVSFSKKQLKYNADKIIETTPAMETPDLHLLDGYHHWMLLSQEYVANGGERFITIGNFKPDHQLNVLKRTTSGEVAANNWAYMYLDSVVVKPIKSKSECSCVNEIYKEMVVDPPAQLSEAISIQLESVLFNFDEDELTEEARGKLKSISKLLLKNNNMFIEINGHTDIIGRAGYNKELSRKRAESVQKFIESMGIDHTRLIIKFHGSELPVAENDSSEGRAQNRRVAFEILEKSYVLHARSENLK